jgi:hypothetical protein
MAVQKVVRLAEYRQNMQQIHIDGISAQAFQFLQEQAHKHNISMRILLKEHLLSIACTVKTVEGINEAQNWLASISDDLSQETVS